MERKMNNLKIRTALFQHNLKQWELAELMGVTEAYVSKILRHELPESKQNDIVKLIEEASTNGNSNA